MYFKKNEGIALIQVLLISTILTLLALQFSYTARQQVKTAQSLIEREEARLLAYSLKNKAIFTLLAFELRGINGLPDDLMQLQNLRIGGEKVRYSQVAQIKLEDLSGRLSIYHPTHPAWERFLTELGYTREQVKNIIQYLIDVQDKDRKSRYGVEPKFNDNNMPYLNRPFQSSTEAQKYLQQYPVLLDNYEKYIHHYANYEISMLHTPELISKAIIGESLPTNFASFEEGEKRDVSKYITGIIDSRYPEESFSTFPSVYKRVNIEIDTGNVLWRDSIDVKLNGLKKPPYTLIGRGNH